MESCFECIFKMHDEVYKETYCMENDRMICDGAGEGNCCICEKFRKDERFR